MTVAETIQLNLPLNLTLSLSHDNFVELATANQDLRLERTATGELIVNPPTGWETGKRNAKITYQLVKWVEELGGGGLPLILPLDLVYRMEAIAHRMHPG